MSSSLTALERIQITLIKRDKIAAFCNLIKDILIFLNKGLRAIKYNNDQISVRNSAPGSLYSQIFNLIR